jgi:hypothetical protein
MEAVLVESLDGGGVAGQYLRQTWPKMPDSNLIWNVAQTKIPE